MQKIFQNRKQASDFMDGKGQRTAYWVERKKIYRMEKISTNDFPTVNEDAGGLWWSGKITVGQQVKKMTGFDYKKGK